MRNTALAVAFVATAAAGSTLCVSAVAQEQRPSEGRRAAFMQACGQDVQTYCASAQNRNERRACVRANHEKFSDACKTFIASHFTHGQAQSGSQNGGQ